MNFGPRSLKQLPILSNKFFGFPKGRMLDSQDFDPTTEKCLKRAFF